LVVHTYAASGAYVVQARAINQEGAVGSSARWTITIVAALLEPDPEDASKTALYVGGTTGNDTIRINPGEGTAGSVRVSINGQSIGTFLPTGWIVVYGQSGNDDIAVAESVRQPVLIFGGVGNDRLKAGGGDAILVGGPGTDVLAAGREFNLFVADRPGDKVRFGGDGNLVIPEITGDSLDESALIAILRQFESAHPEPARRR
jgi:Ca2+-binding RTX toxin-like protein